MSRLIEKAKPMQAVDSSYRQEMVSGLLAIGFMREHEGATHLQYSRIDVYYDHSGYVKVKPDWNFEGGLSRGKGVFDHNNSDAQILEYVRSMVAEVHRLMDEFDALAEGVVQGLRALGIACDKFQRVIPKPKSKKNTMLFQRRVWNNRWNWRIRIKALGNWEPIYISQEMIGEIHMDFLDTIHHDIQSVDHAMQVLTKRERDDFIDASVRDAVFDGQLIHTEEAAADFMAFVFKYGLISLKTTTVLADLVTADPVANAVYAKQKRTLTYHTIKLRRKIDADDMKMIAELKETI